MKRLLIVVLWFVSCAFAQESPAKYREYLDAAAKRGRKVKVPVPPTYNSASYCGWKCPENTNGGGRTLSCASAAKSAGEKRA